MGGGPKVRVVGSEGEDQEESNKGGFFGGAGNAIKDALDNAGDTLSGVGKDAQDNASKAGDSAGEQKLWDQRIPLVGQSPGSSIRRRASHPSLKPKCIVTGQGHGVCACRCRICTADYGMLMQTAPEIFSQPPICLQPVPSIRLTQQHFVCR